MWKWKWWKEKKEKPFPGVCLSAADGCAEAVEPSVWMALAAATTTTSAEDGAD